MILVKSPLKNNQLFTINNVVVATVVTFLLFTNVSTAHSANLVSKDKTTKTEAKSRKHIMRTKYEVYAGGLHGVSAEMRIEYDDDSYKITTWGKTRGFIGFVYPIKASFTTTGLIKNGELIPQRFEEKTKRKKKEKSKTIIYDEAGNAIEKIKIKHGNKNVTKVETDKMVKGSLDYQSVLLKSMIHLKETNSCDQSITLFDGDRNYKVKIYPDINKRNNSIEKTRYSNYSGKATKCSLLIEPIGDDYPKNNWFWKRNGKVGKQMPIDFWLADIKKYALPMMAKSKIDSKGYGSIIVHVTSY
ncbi:MAG: DUF3108 domain-containing protein [Alphaproteobacteria bacterium]|nr:DUF3108 domain-containing protein [Alphaproteobacteria bacterium]